MAVTGRMINPREILIKPRAKAEWNDRSIFHATHRDAYSGGIVRGMIIVDLLVY